MNDTDFQRYATTNFGIGQPVPRTEDRKLVQGQGLYTDDINLDALVYAAMVRSPFAHGVIKSIDVAEAQRQPGVIGVFTGADLAKAGYGPLRCSIKFPNRDGSPMHDPTRPALALDRVRFVGDPVAFVVAETTVQALDAAEAVTINVETLPAVVDIEAAIDPSGAQIFEDVPGNVALDYHYGDSEQVSAAFARAAHVTRLKIANNRVVVNPMETRSAIGSYEKGRWTLRAGCQGVIMLRNQLAEDVFRVPPDQVRVLTRNVGGSFGMKSFVYPEYVCVLHAARSLGRPVKWTSTRSESFLSDQHGRDHLVTAELALDEDGNFLAVRVTGHGNVGGYMGYVAPMMPTFTTMRNLTGPYRTPLIEVAMKCLFTNTPPVSSYRGAGRPEANYYMERLVETAANELGMDSVELRRRNHVRPDEFPHQAPSGAVYDSGDFSGLLQRATELAHWSGFEQRRAESCARGRLRGRGLANFLESTAVPRTKEMGGLRFDADGGVTIITGTLDYGQGHAAPFAQVLCAKLGIPFDCIRLLQGDSDELLVGAGTGGSKSLMQSGVAILEASDQVIEKGRQIAGFVLEAAVHDIDFAAGQFRVAGTDRSVELMELAARLRDGLQLPDGLPQSLDVRHVADTPPSTYPNGCHVIELEIDPETGEVEIVKYLAIDDFGNVVNPLVVDGQVHGGVVQGIGQALHEHVVFSDEGQLLTGSFMDYALPRAMDVTRLDLINYPVPTATNPLGAKGCGEAGCSGALAAVMNAVVDALRPYGIRHMDMPATPSRIWEAIQQAMRV
jgi:carbon-monoxide dehydrogenase large subunit